MVSRKAKVLKWVRIPPQAQKNSQVAEWIDATTLVVKPVLQVRILSWLQYCDAGAASVSWAELGRSPWEVRVLWSQQILGVINLRLTGSKLSFGCSVEGTEERSRLVNWKGTQVDGSNPSQLTKVLASSPSREVHLNKTRNGESVDLRNGKYLRRDTLGISSEVEHSAVNG